jgi:hypothetical protein
MTARKLSGFLSEPTSGLGRLAREAKRLADLNHVWEAIAPPGLARFSRVGPVKDGTLTLYADNGAAAAKLKAQLPRLLSSFRQRGHDITAIRVEVQVNMTPSAPRPPARPPLPPQALAQLEKLATELHASPLKEALTNLIRRQRRSQKGEER